MLKHLFILLALIFIFPSPVFASQEYLTSQELKSLGFTEYEQINNNSLLYPFKKLQEKLFRVSDPELLDTRFKELVFTANKRKTGFLENAAESYISIAGRLIEQKTPNFKNNTETKFRILEKLRDGYPANSLPWIQLQKTVDTTRRLE